MNETTTGGKSTLTMINRESLTIDGITDVISFDDSAIYLDTQNGKMLIEGTSLHITALDVSSGSLSVNGYIISIAYNDRDGSKKAGLFRK